MPKIASTRCRCSTSRYPAPFTGQCVEGRAKTALGDAVGLTQFGVNLTTLKPGAATSLRHWHENEDELVYVLEGELVLVEDEGETVLRAGDCRRLEGRRAQRPSADQPYRPRRRLLEIGTRVAARALAQYPGRSIFDTWSRATRTAHAVAADHCTRSGDDPY